MSPHLSQAAAVCVFSSRAVLLFSLSHMHGGMVTHWGQCAHTVLPGRQHCLLQASPCLLLHSSSPPPQQAATKAWQTRDRVPVHSRPWSVLMARCTYMHIIIYIERVCSNLREREGKQESKRKQSCHPKAMHEEMKEEKEVEGGGEGEGAWPKVRMPSLFLFKPVWRKADAKYHHPCLAAFLWKEVGRLFCPVPVPVIMSHVEKREE